MRLALREEMQKIDQQSVSDYGISIEQLMEKAGSLMAERIAALPGLSSDHRIGIFCGPGHNGGDGLVVARQLLKKGFSLTEVWVLPSRASSVAYELNLRRYQEAGGKVQILSESLQQQFDFNKFNLLIDALFGIGLNRALEPALCQFIEKINRQSISVIALDIPTGLDANRGITWGAGLRAVKTLTCGLAKPGFYLQDGPALTGSIEILNIGFPPQLVKKIADSTFLIGRNSAQKLLPLRKSTSNKSHFGKLLLLAGSPGMRGAALLAAEAAARMGVGYVTMSSPSFDLLKKVLPDFLQVKWKDSGKLDFSKYSAVAIGPGLGTSEGTLELLLKLKAQGIKKVLIDADAITVSAQKKLWPLPATWLLTPHAGELSRIIGTSAADIEADRLKAVRWAHQITGAQVLLKGFHSVLCSGERSYIIASGNVALAKAGTGDVLTGFISSLMAQGLGTDQAAALGSYIHGRIADVWLSKGGSARSLLASDLPKLLNYVLRGIE